MTITTTKKALPKLPIRKESAYEKVSREMDEKETKNILDAKNKIKYANAELERQAKIIRPYLDKLESQIDEKNLKTFWTFPDRVGFKKIHKSTDDIKKQVKSDIPRYQNRPLVRFSIAFHQCEKDTSTHRKDDIWLGVQFTVFYIDKDGRIDNPVNHATGCHFIWQSGDFKTTKFSLKLLEEIMYPVVDRKQSCTSLMGFPLTGILKQLKSKKIDLNEYLNPLAGV